MNEDLGFEDEFEPEMAVHLDLEAPGRWWTLSEKALLESLERASAGDDPEMILLELYANSDTDPEDEEEWELDDD